MSALASEPAADPAAAVERMTTREVMALARISRASLWRRIKAARLPQPVDHAREALFSKAAVITALHAEAAQPASFTVAAVQRLEALRRRRHKNT